MEAVRSGFWDSTERVWEGNVGEGGAASRGWELQRGCLTTAKSRNPIGVPQVSANF